MPFIYSVTTAFDSNKWHSSDETREASTELYSTLKSANRAARSYLRGSVDNDEFGDVDIDEYCHDGCYSGSCDPSKYQSYSAEVRKMRVKGPDLEKGEKDEESDRDSDEESDEESDGESNEGTDSEVEIVESNVTEVIVNRKRQTNDMDSAGDQAKRQKTNVSG